MLYVKILMKYTRIATVINISGCGIYSQFDWTFLFIPHQISLGAYYTTPYYKIGGKDAAREYGVTAGFGLPVPRSRSILSISGQFVRVSGQESTFVNENIFRVSIGLTFNERWFFKRRVE